ncbi:OmpA family protein [Azorhizobium oxalatiphilum]|nr:OmpA family protein [Azorhizobium oxalatiphilum]
MGELLPLADTLRGHALEWFGPFAGMVTVAGQILAAVLALLLIGAGRRLWAPPGHGLQDFAPRIAGLLALVGVVILYAASRGGDTTLSFLQVAIWTAAILLVSAIVYVVAYQLLTLQCPGEAKTYVRGLRLQRDAWRVLINDKGPPPLPLERTFSDEDRPSDARNYFCGCDRAVPEWIWTRGSLVAAQLLLFLLYIPLAVSVILLLAASSFAVQQLDTKVVKTPTATVAQLPADLLFDYDKSTLRPDAQAALEPIAQLIRDRWKSGPVIVAGYSDGKGSDAYNDRLSKDRATSVAQWLATQGKLAHVPFDVQGLGKRDPVAPNALPDGRDNPDGRSRNRRVVVVVPDAAKAN